jgi:signal transduction histidine kinase
MTVAKPGPTLSDNELEELFDPGRSVGSGLELAVCKSLVLRLNGRLHAENGPKGIEIHFAATLANP